MRQRSGTSTTKTRRRKPVVIDRPVTPTYADDDPNKIIEQLRRDLDEALERQTATSEVLRVISSSPTDIRPVLDSILQTAGRLCESEYACFFRLQDGKYHLAGSNNAKAEYIKYLSEHPISVDRGTVVGRTALERRTVHIPDCLVDPEYTAHENARIGKHRSLLGVPLLRDGAPIGVIGLLRTSVKPYTDKQIELVTTFADQAVIAIENVRLFDEVQARTRDLSESLQQQTANMGVPEMCDYSLENVRSRPAKVGDKLTTRDFGTCTRGFGAAENARVAVCVLPGTELAFSSAVKVADFRFVVRWKVETLSHATAIFRQVNKNEPRKHHDALEFPDGHIVLLTQLCEGQEATVLQLPAQPASAAEADAQTRIAYAG